MRVSRLTNGLGPFAAGSLSISDARAASGTGTFWLPILATALLGLIATAIVVVTAWYASAVSVHPLLWLVIGLALTALVSVLVARQQRRGARLMAALAGAGAEVDDLNRKLSAKTHAAQALTQRLRDLAELSVDWVWDTDENHRFTRLIGSQNLEERGLLARVIGRTRWEAVGADPETDEFWANHKADLEAHRPFSRLRYATTATSGKTLHIVISGKPVFDENGVFTGYYGTATDETVAVEALHRAERSEAMLRDAIDSISGGFIIYDADDRIAVFNEVTRKAYHDSADVLTVGSPFIDYLRGIVARGHYPEAIGQEEAWIAGRLAHHQAASGAVEFRTRSGRWVHITERRMSDGGIASVGIDITALKDAQAALGASEARFRQIFDENPLAMALVTTDDYRILQVNEAYCRMLGYTAEELIERSRDDFAVPEDRGIPVAAPQGTPPQWHPADKRFITKNGDTVYARVCVMRLGPLSSGEDVALGIAIDVTEQRRAETALQQAQKMEAIGNLTGGMAHDFNNILGIIVGNLGLARNRLGDNEEMKEIVGEALYAAWRGADLTRRLLAFARRQPLRPARIDINELIPDTVRLLRRLLGENIDVSLRLGEAVWPVMADPAQLEASLANLATNARDAMPRGGTLIIATANRRLDADYADTHPEVTPGEYVMIEVSDTGVGMSREVMSQIFEPFFTTKETGKGTGLGLSMVFGFLRQSGGHVNVYSEPSVGTTFRLFLPRTTEDARERDVIDTAPAAMGAGETVLVVEDNPGMRRIALRQLEELGYRVLECDRGTAALQVLQRQKIDLLFTDIVMPGGLDGVELARLAREHHPNVAIVLTSGFPQDRLHGENEDLANLQLLSKPYGKDELASAIRSALDR